MIDALIQYIQKKTSVILPESIVWYGVILLGALAFLLGMLLIQFFYLAWTAPPTVDQMSASFQAAVEAMRLPAR
ncbi:MAG: hypothetical protein ABI747_01415 [Candidatus Moraniibacteriota bacterium]